MNFFLKNLHKEAAIPAEECWIAERGFSAGSVCDECVAEATDEEQNEADGNPQSYPALFSGNG